MIDDTARKILKIQYARIKAHSFLKGKSIQVLSLKDLHLMAQLWLLLPEIKAASNSRKLSQVLDDLASFRRTDTTITDCCERPGGGHAFDCPAADVPDHELSESEPHSTSPEPASAVTPRP